MAWLDFGSRPWSSSLRLLHGLADWGRREVGNHCTRDRRNVGRETPLAGWEGRAWLVLRASLSKVSHASASALALSRRVFMLGTATLAWSAKATAGGPPLPEPTEMLAPGTRWATPYYALGLGASGPRTVVVAGVHGNERAPPRALRELLQSAEALAPGPLLVIPEANRPALRARSRYAPGTRYADLNRNFPTAKRQHPRGVLARALWQRIVEFEPQWLLDLHEGWGYRRTSRSMGSSVVLAPHPHTKAQTRSMAARVIRAVDAGIEIPEKRFSLIEPGPKGSLARAVNESLGVPALVFETTWVEPMSLRIAQQQLMLRTVWQTLRG